MKFNRLENQNLTNVRNWSRNLEGSLLKAFAFCNAAAFIALLYFSRNFWAGAMSDPQGRIVLNGAAGVCFLNFIFGVLCLVLRRRWLGFEQRLSCDDLTGLMNQVCFEETLEEELRRASRYHFALTLCFLDLDNFTSWNEQFGRDRGNDLLKRFSNFLRGNTRTSDIIGRSENDTFCIVLPHTDLVRSEKFLARLLTQAQEKVDMSFSAGITAYHAGETRGEFVSRAHLALDQAKREGKKRICCMIGGQDGHTTLNF